MATNCRAAVPLISPPVAHSDTTRIHNKVLKLKKKLCYFMIHCLTKYKNIEDHLIMYIIVYFLLNKRPTV